MPGFPEQLELPEGSRYSARYPMAMAYAAVKHAAQSRKDSFGTPYIGHPVMVSILVWRYLDPLGLHAGDVPEDLAIAALLHDVAEDAGGREALDEIADLFGLRVAEIVDRCSDSMGAAGATKAPWQQRKEEHIASVRNLADSQSRVHDPGASLVIACDKLHNLRETAEDFLRNGEAALDSPRFHGGITGTRWYYRSLREALGPALPRGLAHELDLCLEVIRA